jgi:CheY-like chemotaxis protein/DNA-binding CsgD family transcriptional regulator
VDSPRGSRDLDQDLTIVATILVVDDEPDIVLLTKMNLEREGHTIVTAANGEEALEAVREAPPDLIVLDVMMPKVDGWSVLEQLKGELGNPINEIPVILLTALGGPLDRVKGGIEGAVQYLTKPMDLEVLRAAVAEALAGPEFDQRRKARNNALEMLARIERNAAPTEVDLAPRPRLSALERGHEPVRVEPEPTVRIGEERIASLTDKQRQLLHVVSAAPTVMEAAVELGMSRSNVYASLRRINRKLGTRSVRDLLEVVRSGDVTI